jgi:hypothetical protein
MNLRLTLTIATLGLALTQVPAQAGSAMLSCFGGRGVGTCVLNYGGGDGNPHVRTIPAPATEQDKAESAQRERLWVARCKPQMAVDDFGVQRYTYAASACDFGKYQ